MEWMFFLNCLHKLFLDQFTIWMKWFEHLWQKKDLRPHLGEIHPRGTDDCFSVFLCICFLNLFMTVFFCFFYILASHTAASWCCPSLQHVCFPVCRKAWQTVITSTCQWGLINKQILNHMTACLRWCGKSRIFSITLCINFYGVHREN